VNLPDVTQPSRDIARGLYHAIVAVIETPADAAALTAARDVAQLLSLGGLDRLLGVLEAHAGHPWPHELGPALDRVRRTAERCTIDNDIGAFRESDADLARLADHIASFEWTEGPLPGGANRAVFRAVALSDALAELHLEMRTSEEAYERARLNAPTAAALRAAIEWVSGSAGPLRPLEVAVAEGVLELVCTVQDPAGLAAAHAVLAPVGGQLGPWLSDLPAGGRWLMRVPLVTPRALHLMIAQGDLSLALPWASVLRVMMLPTDDLEARAALLAPDVHLLPPLAPLTRGDGERPVVMIASGMLRGLVVADRLVWRLGAEPCAAPGPAPAPLQHAVRGDDGEIYWVADPGVLLAPLSPPVIPSALVTPMAIWSPLPAPTAATPEMVEPSPATAATVSETAAAAIAENEGQPPAAPQPETADESRREAVLEVEDVAPLPLEPRPAGATSGPAPVAANVPSVSAPSRRALVIEDSITARIFLSRMLEARGFSVSSVASGADALREAARGPWWLVCADVELGDVRGAGWLKMLRERVGATSPLAALVRDREDREVAMAAGVSRVLRKPFDEAELSELIQRVADTRESS
jgi:CheY-like chemotaxis protein